jgi:hypothetical protein
MCLRNWIRERLRPFRGTVLRTSYVPFLERLESSISNVGVPVTAIINQATINSIGVATGLPFTSPRRQGNFAGASFLRRPGNRHRLPPLGAAF